MEGAIGGMTTTTQELLVPESRVAEILDRLEGMADALADRMLHRFLDSIPSYRALPEETLRQIREFTTRQIRGFIGGLRTQRKPTTNEIATIRASAELRAREGVPLSGVLAAYRAGGMLAWEEARALIDEEPDLMPAGLEFASALMRWLDDASAAAASAYLAEYERLTADREGSRRDFIDGALGGTLAVEEILARAGALGLDPHASHTIVLLDAEPTAEAESVLRSAQHKVRALAPDVPAAERALGVARGNELVVVFPAAEGEEDEVARATQLLIERLPANVALGLRGGVGRVRLSLADIAASYREASIALTAARAGSSGPIAIYGQVLIEELLLRERGVSRRLAHTVLDPLERYPELRETLVEYIKHGPSLPSVAKRLFLHPNTVAYRLSRIRELTGRDPKTPAGIAELFLALRARQLVGDEPA
jgi:hypothetical protein